MNSSSIVVTSNQMTSSQLGAFERFTRIHDPNERWYDTLMPSFIEYCKRSDGFDGVKKAGPPQSKVPEVITWSVPAYPLEASVGYQNTTNFNFRMPYPYDGNVTRVIEDKTYVQAPALVAANKLPIKSPYQCRRLLFMVGRKQGMPIVRSLGLFDVEFIDRSSAASMTQFRPKTNLSNQQVFAGAVGYRYGIRNIEAENSSAVFMRSNFGQFRHILEQRKYTRFYTKGEVQSSPVQVVFTRMTSSFPQEPVDTASSNLSVYATSSLPYFDGKFRNRPDTESAQKKVTVEFGNKNRRGNVSGQGQ